MTKHHKIPIESSSFFPPPSSFLQCPPENCLKFLSLWLKVSMYGRWGSQKPAKFGGTEVSTGEICDVSASYSAMAMWQGTWSAALSYKLVLKVRVLENTKYIHLNHLRIWPVTQTRHKAMLLVCKENHFAKPTSFTPSIRGEMLTPVDLNFSFWPYLHIGHLKNILEGNTFYQYDAIFPCPLGFMGSERQTQRWI